MKRSIRTSFVLASALLLGVAATPVLSTPVHAAGLPVIDGANLTQTVISATENVAQTLKQIEQYKTQLLQYENMLKNTTAPAQQIWDAANTTMSQLRASIDTLSRYKATLGSIDGYLAKFKDTDEYRRSPCYSVSGCSPAEWAAMTASGQFGSTTQKNAIDALFKGLDQQQDSMQHDAAQLGRLQSAAQGSTGHLQAIGYANQLASHQSNQLLQIRALLIAQQNAIATRNQVLFDREAKEAAASAQLRKGIFRPSTSKQW